VRGLRLASQARGHRRNASSDRQGQPEQLARAPGFNDPGSCPGESGRRPPPLPLRFCGPLPRPGSWAQRAWRPKPKPLPFGSRRWRWIGRLKALTWGFWATSLSRPNGENLGHHQFRDFPAFEDPTNSAPLSISSAAQTIRLRNKSPVKRIMRVQQTVWQTNRPVTQTVCSIQLAIADSLARSNVSNDALNFPKSGITPAWSRLEVFGEPTRPWRENHGKETITGKPWERQGITRIEALRLLPVRLSVNVVNERLRVEDTTQSPARRASNIVKCDPLQSCRARAGTPSGTCDSAAIGLAAAPRCWLRSVAALGSVASMPAFPSEGLPGGGLRPRLIPPG